LDASASGVSGELKRRGGREGQRMGDFLPCGLGYQHFPIQKRKEIELPDGASATGGASNAGPAPWSSCLRMGGDEIGGRGASALKPLFLMVFMVFRVTATPEIPVTSCQGYAVESVLLDCVKFCITVCVTIRLPVKVVDDLISFSLRIPKSLAASIEVTAKRLGLSKSEYARRAMEEYEDRLMHERIAELSRKLGGHSASAAQSMDGSASDGLA
jgi:hypothetical protein